MKNLTRSILLIIFLLGLLKGFAQENYFFRGQAAFEQKNFMLASQCFENHLKQYPKYEPAKWLKANCDIELKKYDQVLSILENSKYKNNNDILLLKARAMAGKGNFIDAIQYLDAYKNSSNKLAEQEIKSYSEFIGAKTLPEWNKLWNSWKYSDRENEMNNIRYAIKTEKIAEASDRLRGYISRYPSQSEAYYLLGNLLFQMDNYKEALSKYETAVNLDSDNINYLLARASALSKSDKNKKALEEFNLILQNDSLVLNAYLGRADVQFLLENYDQALADIRKFRQYLPENTKALSVEAKINSKSGDYLSAISEYGKLIKSNPENSAYFVGRADAYFQTKTYTYAIKDYSMALDLDPKNIETYKKKAHVERLAGDLDAACIDWGHAARLGDIESMNLLRKYCKSVQ